jgi:hypothetical protein
MMTLLKYDFRRNWNTLLAGLAVLIIVQIGLAMFMSDITGSLIGVMAYVGVGVSIYVKMIKTYWSNIRSYNRRLVPVTGLSHVLSPLIFGTLCELGVMVVATIHYFIFSATHTDMNLASAINMSGIHVSEVISLVLFVWWAVLFISVIIFLSISIGGSFRFKTGPWISIIAFFVLTNLISWLENIIFSGRFNPNELFQVTEKSTGISIMSNRILWSQGTWWSVIFEIIVAVILVAAAVYLNNKKVEV